MIQLIATSRKEWGERLLLLGGAGSLLVALAAAWPQMAGSWKAAEKAMSPSSGSKTEAQVSRPESLPKELGRRREAARPRANSSPEAIVSELLAEELRREGEAPSGSSARSADKPPEAELRTVWIQWGPPRSEVYLDGKHVGQTPYAGQYACKEGARVKIQILPPGPVAPIEKVVPCGASTIRLGAAEAVP